MKRMLLRGLSVCFLVTLSALAPRTTLAQVTYTANAGAETEDQSVQADDILPKSTLDFRGRYHQVDICSQERNPHGYLPRASRSAPHGPSTRGATIPAPGA